MAPTQHLGTLWLWLGWLGIFAFSSACTPRKQHLRRPPLAHSTPPPSDNGSSPAAQAHQSQPNPRRRPAPPKDTGPPFSQVVLLNGGLRPEANYYSHLQHLRLMRKALRQRGVPDAWIDVFSSDGENNSADLTVQSPTRKLDKALFALRPEMFLVRSPKRAVNTTMPNKQLRPSRSYALYRYFRKLRPRRGKAAQKPLLLFVTDHGQPNRRNPRNTYISLWGEKINVREWHKMLRPLGRRRVISVMSQCFSGGFAWSNYRRPGQLSPPDGSRCGFYSTTAHRQAYGCYPETGKQLFVGHAHRFAQALERSRTLNEAHQRVTLNDRTPDIPLRSSDSYLKALLIQEAQSQGIALRQLVDQTLARYKRRGYPSMGNDIQHLRAIARRFHLSPPPSLQALRREKQRLAQHAKGDTRLEQAWKVTYRAVRDDVLKQFYRQHNGLWSRIQQKLKFYYHNKSHRTDLPDDPVIQRMRQRFVHFVQQQNGLLDRIKTLHQNMTRMHEQVFWRKIQLAILERMKHQLIRIAGQLYLRHQTDDALSPHKQGLANLLRCEATALGPGRKGEVLALNKVRPIAQPSPAPYPSWLGVSFREVPPNQNARYPNGTVQVRGVYQNTPAADGGVQTGDYIVATNGTPLRSHYDLRERVMLHPPQRPFVLTLIRNNQSIRRVIKLRRTYGTQNLKLQPILGKTMSSWKPLQVLSSQTSLPPLQQSTTLLFFWATWCGPCKAALPTLRRIQHQYRAQGLKVITVSNEKPGAIRNWLQSHPNAMPFVNTQDPNSQFSIHLRITATPTFVLLHHGKVRFSHRGYHKMQKLHRALQHSLNQSNGS